MVWCAILYAGAEACSPTPSAGRSSACNSTAALRGRLPLLAGAPAREREGVALYRGENESWATPQALPSVIANWWGIMRKQKQLNFFTVSYAQLAIVFPYVVAAPRYFSARSSSRLMQTLAFGQCRVALLVHQHLPELPPNGKPPSTD